MKHKKNHQFHFNMQIARKINKFTTRIHFKTYQCSSFKCMRRLFRQSDFFKFNSTFNLMLNFQIIFA
jgi:hypothetical protein